MNNTSTAPIRQKLPATRNSLTHRFNIVNCIGYLTVGLSEDEKPVEIFITLNKASPETQVMMDIFAHQTSLMLQYGVPLEVLVEKFVGARFEPLGFTDNKDIRFAQSIVDYVLRWLALRFNIACSANRQG